MIFPGKKDTEFHRQFLILFDAPTFNRLLNPSASRRNPLGLSNVVTWPLGVVNGSDENVNAGSQDGNPKVRGLILMEPALYALYPRACHFTGSALRVISV